MRLLAALALSFAVLGSWAAAPARASEPDPWVPTGAEACRGVAPPCYARTGLRPTPRRAWTFEAALPVWIPGVSGNFTSGGVKVDVDGGVGNRIDGTFRDLFDQTDSIDFAFVGSFKAQHGPWAFAVEGFGASLGNHIDFTLTDGRIADASITAAIACARVCRRVWTKPLRLGCAPSCLKLDAFAGARWYYAEFDVTLPLGIEADASESWIDPIVGLEARLSMGRRWVLRARGDVGGFGVGADVAWWLTAALEYRLTRVFSLAAGWALMDADYSAGAGDRFAWNLTLSGPQLIAAFRF